MSELFAAGDALTPLDLPGGELYFLDRFALPETGDALLARLIADTPWAAQAITLWGRQVPQPRLMAWYGDPDAVYRYSNTTFTPLPWTPLLRDLRARVEGATGRRYNSVLLNYYRDGRDGMGMHSDDEPELGLRPAIASLSLGAPRVLTFKHRHDAAVKPLRILLGGGALLLMAGDTQRNWRHGVAKTARPVGARINLTFRLIGAAR